MSQKPPQMLHILIPCFTLRLLFLRVFDLLARLLKLTISLMIYAQYVTVASMLGILHVLQPIMIRVKMCTKNVECH